MITDTRRIRALVQVAERGTITAAAEALGYTPSAVSQQLAALEAELGVPVLERQGRNVVLTEAGQIVVDHGRHVLAALDRTGTAVAELHGEPVGPVRIGALPSATAALLPAALARLAGLHPRVEPHVTVHPLDDNVRELRLGSLDLAVDQVYDTAPHDLFDGLERTLLLEEPMVLLSPVDDPRDSVAETAACDWIASPPDSACGRSVRAVNARYGLCPSVRYETEDYTAVIRLVAAGLAVALVPQLGFIAAPAEVHVASVPEVTRRIYAFTRPGSMRPAVRAVVDQLVETAAATCTTPPTSSAA